MLATILFILFVWMILCFITIWSLKREERKKQIKPPLKLELMRLPGESLLARKEQMLERTMFLLLMGIVIPAMMSAAPVVVGPFFGWQHTGWQFGIGFVLMVATAFPIFTKAVQAGRELRNCNLGLAGERAVAEALQELSVEGYYIFHDVPMTRNSKTAENLDHVAVGPHGVILIETKTRGIDAHDRLKASTVTFDGERLIWPRWGNDFESVKQVKRGGAWLAAWLKENCGLETAVHQVIAIPGWTVTPGNFYNPRVVSAEAVASSFLHRHEDKPLVLKPKDIKNVVKKLREMNRTADW